MSSIPLDSVTLLTTKIGISPNLLFCFCETDVCSWKPILECIESRFDAYLEAENKPHRTNIIDNRIHACIYFIQPTGHSLKPLDIEFMRRLHSKVHSPSLVLSNFQVNLIPVIAKADTLTGDEIIAF